MPLYKDFDLVLISPRIRIKLSMNYSGDTINFTIEVCTLLSHKVKMGNAPPLYPCICMHRSMPLAPLAILYRKTLLADRAAKGTLLPDYRNLDVLLPAIGEETKPGDGCRGQHVHSEYDQNTPTTACH